MREPHFFQSENPDAECPTCRFPSWSHDPAQVYMALQRHREAAIVDSLDAAWAAAEAALPEGWRMQAVYWFVDDSEWVAVAYGPAPEPVDADQAAIRHGGDTPTAALTSLADALEARQQSHEVTTR